MISKSFFLVILAPFVLANPYSQASDVAGQGEYRHRYHGGDHTHTGTWEHRGHTGTWTHHSHTGAGEHRTCTREEYETTSAAV